MDIGLMEIAWAIVYIMAFFGSLSFGYLVLRFNIPDIRIVPREAKLGLSGIVGIIIFVLSVVMSLFLNAIFLIFIPLWTLVFTGLFEIFQMFSAKKEVTVAIPVAKLESTAFKEKKPVVEPREMSYRPRVLEEKELSDKGMVPKEVYIREEERQAPVPIEKPEISKAREEQEIKSAREKYREELARRTEEEEYRKLQEAAEKEIPSGKPMEGGIESNRRRRYMERRGVMIEEVKTDMFKAADRKEREKYEKELFKESAPATATALEELTGGLDVEELEKITSIGELSDLGLGSLTDMDSKELEELAGLAEPEKIPKQKGMGCPKCGSAKSTIVYCPYCGKGFCSNCSDKVQRKGELIFYGCPHCRKEVIVKGET